MDDSPPLPPRDLRDHILASAVRTAEAELREHGYPDPDRGLEVLAYAIDEMLAEDEEDEEDESPIH